MTLRVKYAFLMMNAQSLRDRLHAVRKRQTVHHECLSTAPEAVVQEYTPPEVVGMDVEESTEDPNALCVPQAHDYDLL